MSNDHTKIQSVLIMVIALLFFSIHLPLSLNHDASWHFYTSFRFLAGDRIGLEIFDINPPMSMWLFSPPAILVNLFDVSAPITFKIYFFSVSVGVLFLVRNLFKACGLEIADIYWLLVALSAILLLFPGYDYAQREQFVSVLTLPYVIAVYMRAKNIAVNKYTLLFVGMLAGLGVGIKPYFLVLPIFLELYLIVKTRTINTVFNFAAMALFATLVFYVLVVLVFAPDYLFNVVPNALGNYSAFQQTWSEYVIIFVKIISIPLMLFIICALWSRSISELNLVFFISVIAFMVAAIMQQKNWNYQYYPAFFYLYICLTFYMIDFFKDTEKLKILKIPLVVIFSFGLLNPSIKFLIDGYHDAGTEKRVSRISEIIKEHGKAEKKVFAFITSPRDVHPAVLNVRGQWTGNAGAQVFLPALLLLDKNDTSIRAEKIRKVALEHDYQTVQGLIQQQPDVLMFDEGSFRLAIYDPNFKYIKYYSQFPEFKSLMNMYVYLENVGKFKIFVKKLK